MEAFVRTSGPVLSSNKPSLVHITLLTGPPVVLQVREKEMLVESRDDVRRKLMVMCTIEFACDDEFVKLI